MGLVGAGTGERVAADKSDRTSAFKNLEHLTMIPGSVLDPEARGAVGF
jgi:hypothetical protein